MGPKKGGKGCLAGRLVTIYTGGGEGGRGRQIQVPHQFRVLNRHPPRGSGTGGGQRCARVGKKGKKRKGYVRGVRKAHTEISFPGGVFLLYLVGCGVTVVSVIPWPR